MFFGSKPSRHKPSARRPASSERLQYWCWLTYNLLWGPFSNRKIALPTPPLPLPTLLFSLHGVPNCAFAILLQTVFPIFP